MVFHDFDNVSRLTNGFGEISDYTVDEVNHVLHSFCIYIKKGATT